MDELAELLKAKGFRAEGLHGDLSQHQRDVAMGRFRNGSSNILIATDVAARGIDVDDVEAVINYDVPQDIEYYVHRIGRTGRAGKTGRSFTFVTAREVFRIREIEKYCRTHVEEKKLPGASKVLKTKAEKYLAGAWKLHEHEDMELMKEYLKSWMDKEGCDAMTVAAAMLKYQIGDIGEEIPEDKPVKRQEYGRSRGDNRGRRGDRRDGEKRFFDRKRDNQKNGELKYSERRNGNRKPQDGNRKQNGYIKTRKMDWNKQ